MTTEEFKTTYPEMAHLESDELWDAMTMQMLNQQQGEEIIKTTLPFWKRYKFRYMFYVRKPNMVFTKEWQSDKVCNRCKRGSSTKMLFGGFGEKSKALCLGCGNELIEVPNRHLKYLLWLNLKPLVKLFWGTLQYIHLIKYDVSGRYDLFGDESGYAYTTYNIETSEIKHIKKPRKWFEYIFIKK